MNLLKNTRIVFFTFLSLAIASCSKDALVENAALSAVDVSYGTAAKQRMDIYLPANRSTANTKSIIMIHGGGWSEGDKSEFTPYVDSIKKRFPAFAVFNINYRLASGTNNLFPTQENDVKAAVEAIYNKRTEYNISGKMVLLGASAGAHLAMLQAYKNSDAIQVKAVVNFFGPSDMNDLYNNPASVFVPPSLVASVVGATPTTNASLYFQSSPINFVTSLSPPTITLQGGLDPLVRPQQQLQLNNKLSAAGVVHEYVFYPGEYHGWTGPQLIHSFDQIQAFLNTHVQ